MSLENDVRVLKQQAAAHAAALHWLTSFTCRLIAATASDARVREAIEAELATEHGARFSSLLDQARKSIEPA